MPREGIDYAWHDNVDVDALRRKGVSVRGRRPARRGSGLAGVVLVASAEPGEGEWIFI